MTNDETIAAELARIQLELENIARWRAWTENPIERRHLDETALYWLAQERRWQRLAQQQEQR